MVLGPFPHNTVCDVPPPPIFEIGNPCPSFPNRFFSSIGEVEFVSAFTLCELQAPCYVTPPSPPPMRVPSHNTYQGVHQSRALCMIDKLQQNTVRLALCIVVYVYSKYDRLKGPLAIGLHCSLSKRAEVKKQHSQMDPRCHLSGF